MPVSCLDTLSSASQNISASQAVTHVIELSHFDAYFHLFASLNLAYAGSKTVRALIDREILQISIKAATSISKLRQEFEDNVKLGIAGINEEATKKEFEEIVESYHLGRKAIEEKQKSVTDKYTAILKAMFLNTAVYVFLVLLLAGFQQELSTATVFNSLLLFNLLFFYNVYVFFASYAPEKPQLVSSKVTLLVILFMILITLVHCIFCPKAEHHYSYISPIISVCFCLFFCVSPFLLAFVRGNMHRKPFIKEYEDFVKAKLEEIKTFISHLNWLRKMQNSTHTKQ